MSVIMDERRTAHVLPFTTTSHQRIAEPRAFRRVFLLAVCPFVGLVAATLLLTLTRADLAISALFYDQYAVCWPMSRMQPWQVLYQFGCLPGIALGLGGLIVALFGMVGRKRNAAWRPGLFLVCVLLLGPGLLVNLCMKDCWGRPRPREVVDFGGERAYHPVWSPTFDRHAHSFPSGHASMGFYLMTPGFLFLRSRKRTALLFFLFGLSAGLLMGTARIVQGSHFATDVMWSAGFVYFAGLVSTPLLQSRAGRRRATPDSEDDDTRIMLPAPSSQRRPSETPQLPKAA